MVKRTVIARTAAGRPKQSLRRIAALLAALLLSILPAPAAPSAPIRGISVMADDPLTGERAEDLLEIDTEWK